MSVNVLAFVSLMSASQTPENALPRVIRAVHVPRQRVPVFLAVQVPSITRSSDSFTNVQYPSAEFGLEREIPAPHDPRNV